MQFLQELFVPFRAEVTWMWQALNDQPLQDVMIKSWGQLKLLAPRRTVPDSKMAGMIEGSVGIRLGRISERICDPPCIRCRQTTPPLLSSALSAKAERRQGPPTTRSNRDLLPYQLAQTAACQRTEMGGGKMEGWERGTGKVTSL